ncbi:hypothetical protein DID77_01900 [Candidatus Marinamargulisbacteria bacterium SCGC AG-439-L15]|nr:hypothetical protein DID77_01900 [Candidatus Marinamargulisbacteria bacterium SCGC AG-439-L15]
MTIKRPKQSHINKQIQTIISQLPSNPGIYKMLDKTGAIIYVGKAKNLKTRVSSYFKQEQNSFKTSILVSQITSIDTIITQTEEEALILENQLIKHHQPKYNIQLKDDKTYPFIKVTVQELFPRIIVTRHKEKDGARYFGPFPSMGSSRKMRRLLYDLFPLRDCTQKIDLETQQPKCINLDIGKCIGPCVIKSIKQEYDKLVSKLCLFLSGKSNALVTQLKQEMTHLSLQKEYEKAAIVRDKIEKIQTLTAKQTVCLSSKENIHCIALLENEQYHYVLVQEIIDGKLLYQSGLYTTKKDQENRFDFFNQFLRTYYAEHNFPHTIICQNDCYTYCQNITTLSTKKIKLITPSNKSDNKHILSNCLHNAKAALYRLSKAEASPLSRDIETMLETLKKDLELPIVPKRIIGFDISHYYGKNIVASAVFFENGYPVKNKHRHYKINSLKNNKSNDPAAIYEVVLKRLYKLYSENETPDLLVIDGGKPQLNACLTALKEIPFSTPIPCISLAKREEEIYTPIHKKTIKLEKSHSGLQYLQRIRDKSHQFANDFQKQQRHKAFLETPLTHIPGIGKEKVQSLYKQFKTLEHIKDASSKELEKVPGIGPQLAKRIPLILNA